MMIFKQFYKWKPKIASFFKEGETIIIGHRGAPFLAHENTLESFNQAFKANLKGVELDIQLSKDENLVIFHDWEIKTNNQIFRKISSLDYLDISLISKYNDFQIPLLKDLIKILPNNSFLNIEIKSMKIFNFKLEKILIKLLTESNILNRVIISSFNPFILNRIKKNNAKIITALLWTNENSPLLINSPLWVWFCKPDGFHIDFNYMDEKIINWVKNKKMSLLSYTVNNKKDYLWAKKMNLNGIFTDNPNLLSKNKNNEL